MNLTFSDHLSAKTSSSYSLKVYPRGKPEDFLVEREDREQGEGQASTCVYEFPDDSVVIASTEFGPSIADPDDRGDLTIEVHIGPEADAALAEAVEAEAREMAAAAGIATELQDNNDLPDMPVFFEFSGFSVVRH